MRSHAPSPRGTNQETVSGRWRTVHRPCGHSGCGRGRRKPPPARLQGDARRGDPGGDESPASEMGIGEEYVPAVLHGERRVAHPGHRGGLSFVLQISAVVYRHRHPGRDAFVVGIFSKLPLQHLEAGVPEGSPGIEEMSGLPVRGVEEIRIHDPGEDISRTGMPFYARALRPTGQPPPLVRGERIEGRKLAVDPGKRYMGDV